MNMALERFKEEVVVPVRSRVLLHWERLYVEQRERLKQEFVHHFGQFCERVLHEQQIGEHGPIGHVTYSMLRTSMLEGRFLYLAEASDETWLFDPRSVESSYDAAWAFGYLNVMKSCWEEELERPGSPFRGAIHRPDVERLLIQESAHGHAYVTSLIRHALPDALACEAFDQLDKCDAFEVRVGEYLDVSESVYRRDYADQDEAAIRKWLSEGNDEAYGYGTLERMDLSGMNMDGMDLRFSAFRSLLFGGGRFQACNLTGTSWEGCELTDTRWDRSDMYGTRFRGSRLVGATFYGVNAQRGLPDAEQWNGPGFDEISFAECDLREADFMLANLGGADFRGADLRGAVFGVCNLTGADFRGADVTKTDFTGSLLTEARMDEGAFCLLHGRPEARERTLPDGQPIGNSPEELKQAMQQIGAVGGQR
ncbi:MULTISPECIES: pentapeptide repeat-containing protein [Paenibacillus]|uniref:pentapeptide repeat-containing protein n=1 Tax=Paenibacillus TaxID=44249 RepID=UPI001F339E25|nr:pentapeptide repeat-containing protein [Paenibacillus sp. JJ-223]CAH1225297.1 hypothetical protein PAECIP111890_05781 [Paenibacillus sp. JJ-223]